MESPVYQDWLEEEIVDAKAEGKAEGKLENTQGIMCKYLARKFGSISVNLQQKVLQMTNQDILDYVIEELFAATTLNEAKAVINDGIRSELKLKDNND